jgi:hypothetical protein
MRSFVVVYLVPFETFDVSKWFVWLFVWFSNGNETFAYVTIPLFFFANESVADVIAKFPDIPQRNPLKLIFMHRIPLAVVSWQKGHTVQYFAPAKRFTCYYIKLTHPVMDVSGLWKLRYAGRKLRNYGRITSRFAYVYGWGKVNWILISIVTV